MQRMLHRVALGMLLITLLAIIPPVARSATQWNISSPVDDGPGTLRQALRNAVSGDTIVFNADVFPLAVPKTIFLLSGLPAITQSGLSLDASGAGVILDGSLLVRTTDVNGLTISASRCVIRGLTIQKFPRNNGNGSNGNGIMITAGSTGNIIGGNHDAGQGNLLVDNDGEGIAINGAGANGNVVIGNYIGADKNGATPRPNKRNGVAILNGASNNTVGGTAVGERNLIGGNLHNGVWIAGAGTTSNLVIGNYIGARADGLAPLDNHIAGVGIHNGASGNRIGGANPGERNLISGNRQNGVDIRDPGTSANQVLGNFIGTNADGTAKIGGLLNGVIISNGATNNRIGDNTAGGGNLISGNQDNGVRIGGSGTAGNVVQGNYIGANAGGTLAIPNGLHGVEITDGAHDNTIGGDRTLTQGNPLGQGNLLSGNLNHGLVIHFDAHHNTASGNLIGPDASGNALLGPEPHAGSDIAEGAHDNTIGGSSPGQANVISGNQTDGIALFDSTGRGANDNKLIGNLIGLGLNGAPLANHGPGIANVFGARRTTIYSNTVAFNQGYGIWVAPCVGISTDNVVSQNSVYNNTMGGLLTSCTTPAPSIRMISAGSNERVGGTTFAGAQIEIFSDDDNQGRYYEGTTQADSNGNFSFAPPRGRFISPNITATSRDNTGNTSSFSEPAHALWTILLYLNGDNDLSQVMLDTTKYLAEAGPSPRANVLALADGKSGADTVLYDLTRGQRTKITGSGVITSSNERNMGDGKTLIDFVAWGKTNFPARHTMLSILDHGGGWAPSSTEGISGTLPRRGFWLAGGSGLSWDFNPGAGTNSDYDYLDSPEIKQALATITNDGTNKLDVLFYDVCLMGMLEVAYQVKDYTAYFVSSQNIGWAPEGPQGRYVLAVHGIETTTTPLEMAKLLVRSYANSIPDTGHPFTISAVDTSKVAELANATNQLALALSQRLANQSRADLVANSYRAAQKIDYDADFFIEPNTDGFVDLADFASQIALRFASDQVIVQHTAAIIAQVAASVVAEAHLSGNPWVYSERLWNLDRVHGLSIFLPLGEDLILVLPSTQPGAAPADTGTLNLPIRNTYTSSQLAYVGATKWKDMIDTYYNIVATPVPTSTAGGPIDGLLPPDIVPPQTTVTVTTDVVHVGTAITITWRASDTQLNSDGKLIAGSGVTGADLWYRPPFGSWAPYPTDPTQAGPSGVYRDIHLDKPCGYRFGVLAHDRVGNDEPLEHGANRVNVYVINCPQYMPTIRR